MRFVFSFLLLFTLASCNFNVTPTFYVRDVQDVISDNKAIDIPIFLKIPATDVDSCNSEIGQVLGILSTHGMDGTLLSCSTDEDNFFAIANVEFMATVIPSKFSQADNFNGIVGLIVEQGEEGIYYLNLQANPRLPRAMGDIEGALFFATLDASQVGFVITLNNVLSSYIPQSGSHTFIVNQLNIRLSINALNINGISFNKAGNLHR